MQKFHDGLTALITGSTSGIGLGMARTFLAKRIPVVLHGLEKQGPALASQLSKEFDVPVFHSAANLAHSGEIENLVEFATASLGKIDILVNNAGIQFVSPIDTFPSEKWDQILQINLTAPFLLSKAVWPQMKSRGFGRIINIASVHGLRASEYKAAYVAAKHGLVGLTKVQALEGAGLGITANALCPGYVRTPLVENQIADQARAHSLSPERVVSEVLLKKQPVKEFVSIEAIGELALYLVSLPAFAVTGTTFSLDGGWTAQ